MRCHAGAAAPCLPSPRTPPAHAPTLLPALVRTQVSHQLVRPGYGEVVVYEHPFVNPYESEMVRVMRARAARAPSASTPPRRLHPHTRGAPIPVPPPPPAPPRWPLTQVFELRISSPSEVCVLSRGEEYRGLKAASVRFLGTPPQSSTAAGLGSHVEVEPEMMGGNRLYMRVRCLVGAEGGRGGGREGYWEGGREGRCGAFGAGRQHHATPCPHRLASA